MYTSGTSAMQSVPIGTPGTTANPSGVQIYGASQGNTGTATGGQAGTASQTGSGTQSDQPTSPVTYGGEIDSANNWIWYLDVDGTPVWNVDSLPIAGPGDVPDAPGTGIGPETGGANEPIQP
jgi:hypothetical protein